MRWLRVHLNGNTRFNILYLTLHFLWLRHFVDSIQSVWVCMYVRLLMWALHTHLRYLRVSAAPTSVLGAYITHCNTILFHDCNPVASGRTTSDEPSFSLTSYSIQITLWDAYYNNGVRIFKFIILLSNQSNELKRVI